MIEYHGNSGVEIDTQRFLGINTPFVGSNWGQGPYWTDNRNEALVLCVFIRAWIVLFRKSIGKLLGDYLLICIKGLSNNFYHLTVMYDER